MNTYKDANSIVCNHVNYPLRLPEVGFFPWFLHSFPQVRYLETETWADDD